MDTSFKEWIVELIRVAAELGFTAGPYVTFKDFNADYGGRSEKDYWDVVVTKRLLKVDSLYQV